MKLHGKRIVKIGLLLYFAYLLFGCVFPFLCHKRVGSSLKDSFQAESCYSDVGGPERALCIDENAQALLWRLRVIESAQDEIILSTFDFCVDDSGQDIMSALLHAAQRDVHIRVLVDGINGMLKLHGTPAFNALISHPNIEVRFYNIIHPLKPWTINPRMHDKYLVADNFVYILGGRNTSDLFLGDYVEEVNIDRDILIYETTPNRKDTSLAQLQSYFEAIWALPCNRNMTHSEKGTGVAEAAQALQSRYEGLKVLYPTAFEGTDYRAATLPTNQVTLLTNPPEPINKEPELWYMLQQLMMNGDEVIIQTPYIVCSRDMYQDLTAVCGSTGTVEIITNAVESGANPWGCTDYLNQKENILQTGAHVYELIGQNSSHTKTILIDARMSIVGSYNLDMRSTYLDTEMMLAVDCPALNEALRACADRDKAQSKHVFPDGTYEYGLHYAPVALPFFKSVVYAIFRIVIVPFRHLL